jgi:hypothetical protein
VSRPAIADDALAGRWRLVRSDGATCVVVVAPDGFDPEKWRASRTHPDGSTSYRLGGSSAEALALGQCDFCEDPGADGRYAALLGVERAADEEALLDHAAALDARLGPDIAAERADFERRHGCSPEAYLAAHPPSPGDAPESGGGWNHRVVRRAWASGEVTHEVHEVYYRRDGSICGATSDPVAPSGETLDELRADLARMASACDAPVLAWEECERASAAGALTEPAAARLEAQDLVERGTP